MKEINNSYGIVKLNTNSQVVLHSLKYDTSDFVGNGFFESESITGLNYKHKRMGCWNSCYSMVLLPVLHSLLIILIIISFYRNMVHI